MTLDFGEAMQAAYERDAADEGWEVRWGTDFTHVQEQRDHDEEYARGELADEDYLDDLARRHH